MKRNGIKQKGERDCMGKGEKRLGKGERDWEEEEWEMEEWECDRERTAKKENRMGNKGKG